MQIPGRGPQTVRPSPHPLPCGSGPLAFPSSSPLPWRERVALSLSKGRVRGPSPLLPVRNDKVLKRLLPLHRHRLARSREILQGRSALQPPRKLLP